MLTYLQGSVSKKSKPLTSLDSSMRRANILKPQNAFEIKPNNLDTAAWKPILTKKPHAALPLKKSLTTFNNDEDGTQYDCPVLPVHFFL